MPRYSLDANVFIEAKNGPYAFDIVPAFWDWLDQMAAAETAYACTMVYDELSKGEDDLADWVKSRKNSQLFVVPDAAVQARFLDIADFVSDKYPEHNAAAFLGGADPWIIAHAMVDCAIVVTLERLVPPGSQKVKIPNVCERFCVKYANTYEMLRQERARLRFG